MNGTDWFAREEEVLSEINITPLVDVALVLLIIFMITAPMMVQGAEIRLPETEPMQSLPADGLYISIDADGKVYLNQTEIPLIDLPARLSPLAAPGRLAYLRADRTLSYDTVIQVMERLMRAGLDNIGLVIEPRLRDRR